jgi:hypothetical protein
MGAAALVLRDNELAIHGTNNPGSIGGFVSAGCIRMHNKDIMDLFGRVSVGTSVVFPRVAVASRPAVRAEHKPAAAVAAAKPAAEAPAAAASTDGAKAPETAAKPRAEAAAGPE